MHLNFFLDRRSLLFLNCLSTFKVLCCLNFFMLQGERIYATSIQGHLVLIAIMSSNYWFIINIIFSVHFLIIHVKDHKITIIILVLTDTLVPCFSYGICTWRLRQLQFLRFMKIFALRSEYKL